MFFDMEAPSALGQVFSFPDYLWAAQETPVPQDTTIICGSASGTTVSITGTVDKTDGCSC